MPADDFNLGIGNNKRPNEDGYEKAQDKANTNPGPHIHFTQKFDHLGLLLRGFVINERISAERLSRI